eukprot:SAG11_NODE_560_length_8528_cov_4.697710_12_plen_153_part_00
MSHDEEESEGGYPDISRKYLYPAEGGRIRLTSPRFKSALLEVGVVIDELYELPEDKFMRPGGDAEIARQEWEAYDDMRLEKVALVVEARRRLVRQGKGGGPRRSSKLLDNSSLLQLSKQQVFSPYEAFLAIRSVTRHTDAFLAIRSVCHSYN